MTMPRKMTPAALREIADWLDTYDALALSFFDLLQELGRATPEELVKVRFAAKGTEIQDSLRHWAVEIEGTETMTEETCPTCGKEMHWDRNEGIWYCEDDWEHG